MDKVSALFISSALGVIISAFCLVEGFIKALYYLPFNWFLNLALLLFLVWFLRYIIFLVVAGVVGTFSFIVLLILKIFDSEGYVR